MFLSNFSTDVTPLLNFSKVNFINFSVLPMPPSTDSSRRNSEEGSRFVRHKTKKKSYSSKINILFCFSDGFKLDSSALNKPPEEVFDIVGKLGEGFVISILSD